MPQHIGTYMHTCASYPDTLKYRKVGTKKHQKLKYRLNGKEINSSSKIKKQTNKRKGRTWYTSKYKIDNKILWTNIHDTGETFHTISHKSEKKKQVHLGPITTYVHML